MTQKILPALAAGFLTASALVLVGPTRAAEDPAPPPASVDELLICDCTLPPQIRSLGQRRTFLGPRRVVRTTVLDCKIRGGEYVVYDRANYRTALQVWMVAAEGGDPEAMNYVGEIYERGLGTEPNYEMAAEWYGQAAKKGFKPAQINLGYLYEAGLGVEKDAKQALEWYRKASGKKESILLDAGHAIREDGSVPEAAMGNLEGPEIVVIHPSFIGYRNAGVVPVRPGVGETGEIVGRVTAPAGLVAFRVSEDATPVDAQGFFSAVIPVRDGSVPVLLTAVDRQGKEDALRLRLVPDDRGADEGRDAMPKLELGRYTALVIGNASYVSFSPLETPENDARAVARVLESEYGFRVVLKLNATRKDVIYALYQLSQELTDRDNLVIYYAGHGNKDGYWTPVDADPENRDTWVPTSEIQAYMTSMIQAKQILVIADSCFPETFSRSSLPRAKKGVSPEALAGWYREMSGGPTRVALTAGGVEPVPEPGQDPEGRSVFNTALTAVLSENGGVLESLRLRDEVAARVVYASRGGGGAPEPACASVRGHERGDFILIRTP